MMAFQISALLLFHKKIRRDPGAVGVIEEKKRKREEV